MSERNALLPTTWPILWRRLFLLTLPISGPLYVAAVIVGFTAIIIFVLPVAWLIMDAWPWVARMWVAR